MKVIYKALLSILIICWFSFNGFSQATLTIGTVNGTPGNSISVPIQATGIADMTGFQFTITYDKTKISFVDCTNWTSMVKASNVQINSMDGKLTFVYTDLAINIANEKFFDLNFTVLNSSSGNAAISWSDNPTQRELSNSIPNEINCSYSNGAVIISIASIIAPVATTATNIAQTSFSANWNSSATATGYRLDVALDNGFTNCITGYQNLDVRNVTTFQISGCVANTIYYYRVKAYNGSETSGASNTISLTTLLSTILIPPVAITATNITQTSFSANWNSSATATGYRLDVALDNSFTSYLMGYQSKDVGNVTTLPITGLLSDTTYYYRVKAYNTGATSGVSNTINVTTRSNQNGATLTIGNGSGTSGNAISIPVSAINLSDVVGFQFTIVYDQTKLTFINCTNWVAGLNATNVQINQLEGKLTFVYTDVAINIANGKFFDLNFTVINGSSGNATISWSDNPTQRELSNSIPNEISCIYSGGTISISICNTPGIPTSVTGTATSQNTANLSWSTGNPVGSSAVTYYWVVGTDALVTWGRGVAQGSTTGTSASTSALSGGTTYYLRVYSSTNCNNTSSEYGTSIAFITSKFCTAPSAPAKCIASIGDPSNGLEHWTNLSCDEVFEADGYSYEYSLDGVNWEINWFQTESNIINVNHHDSPNVPVYYRVKAYKCSPLQYSSYTYASPQPIYTACDIPAALTIDKATNRSLNITLNPETPIENPWYTKYCIYYFTEPDAGYVQSDGTLGDLPVYKTKNSWGTITVNGLSNNEEYCFYAFATNNDGDVMYNEGNFDCGTTTNITASSLLPINGSFDFKVFPNPVTNQLTIELKGNTNKVDFEIINSLGQAIFTGQVLESTVVPTTNFTPGIYLIKLKSGKTFEFKKIVKN